MSGKKVEKSGMVQNNVKPKSAEPKGTEKKDQAKGNKRTLRQEWELLRRGVKIWNEIVPGLWTIQFLCILVETFSPYFGLYLSAEIVNELAGDCRLERLLSLAAITVVGGFLISVLTRIFQGKLNLKKTNLWQKHEAYLVDAQNKFQYEHLENPDVVLKRSEIFAVFNAFGGGLGRIIWSFPLMIRRVLDIIFSVSLTLSIFALSAEGNYSGLLGFINSPASAVVVVVLIVVNGVCSVKISNTRTVKNQEAISELAMSNSRVGAYNSLWGADMVVFNLNRIVLEEYRKYNLRPEWVFKVKEVSIKYNSYTIILNAILNIAVFIFVAAKAFIGVFGIGNFILYQGTIGRFIQAVSGLAAEVGLLKHNNQYLVQLYDYLDMPNDMYKGTLIVEKRDDIDYEIEFRDVSFKYPRTDTWALRHVNMKFKIGDKLAIVGENGSGKTTFIKLLCRLYDPTEGKILLNGIDITRYRYDEYMALFSVVFQDYSLFGFPLGENVAASLVYDEERVRDCLIRAGLGEKLAELEAGAAEKGEDSAGTSKKNPLDCALGRNYDSDGIDLSGGEYQKVALARALYKDAPFVVLDEPTAALDPLAEAEVYENFNVLVENKTAVFISHRLSSCRFCHSIAVFDKGELIQQGSHEELVADEDGKYSQLWHAQAKYYADNSSHVSA